MPARKHHHDDKGLLKRRSARPKAQHDDQFGPKSSQKALIQRARQGASPHSAADLVQLQRLVGNRAVMRQLERASGGASTAIQRAKKSAEDRSTKHQRIAKAKEAIPILSAKLKDELADHVFDAKPFGKKVDPKDPQGLHAYKNGGNLPDFVEEVSTKGSKGQVHQLIWKNKKGVKPKSSTMFPDWMPPDHVKTLIVLKFSDDTGKVVKEKIDFNKLGINQEGVKTYISHGQDINLEKKGDTVYPTR